jgi:multimeric flavodoxin WrbA
MLKVLVVYDSKTGNTEKMALAVAKGAEQVSDVEVTMKKVEKTSPDDLLAADAVIMGSPTYFGQMSTKARARIYDYNILCNTTEKFIHIRFGCFFGGGFRFFLWWRE